MSNNPNNIVRNGRPKDPQVITTSRFLEKPDANYLVFSIQLGLLELKCVAKIPDEDEKNAPVYVNYKLPAPGTSQVQTEGGGSYVPRAELDRPQPAALATRTG